MERRVVITGLGIVAPGAKDKVQFWENLKEGKSCINEITKCSVENISIKSGGQIDKVEYKNHIDKRFMRKCDEFSKYAYIAASEALKDSNLEIEKIGSENIGVYIGNNSGGWNNAENGLKCLHDDVEEKKVSPYLASNWFPAAAQGVLTIQLGITGYSKTVIADMASSSIAIGNAYKLIKSNKIDYMIAGGTEALIVPWGLKFYETNEIISKGNDYLPFDNNRNGSVLGEGSAFVVLEEYESAKKRGAHIYAEILGSFITNDGKENLEYDETGKEYARCIKKVIKDDNYVDYISLAGVGIEIYDNCEIEAINKVFGDKITEITASCPKAFYGNSIGAAGAMDLVTTCLSMENSMIIKTGNISDKCSNINFNLVANENIEKNIDTALIMSKGFGGINSSILIKK